jgi:hypothetical protein
MAYQSTVSWEAAPALISACAVELTVICFSSLIGWSSPLVMKDQMEVCPLSRGIMSPFGSIPIRPITGRPSLSPSSFTRNSISLPYGLLSLLPGEVTGLPRSAYIPLDGLGAVSPPVGRHLRQEMGKSLNLPTCLLAQACQRLWLVNTYDVYQQFTSVHHTIPS